MDDPDRSPLVSSSTSAGQPEPPLFQYQFVRDEEEDDEDEDEEEEVDDEQLEVRERKPAAPAPASAPLRDSGVAVEQPPPAPQPTWTTHPAPSAPFAFPDASEFSLPEEKEKQPPRSAPLPPPPAPPHGEEPRAPAVPPRSAPLPPKREEPPAVAKTAVSRSPDETLFALPVASEPLMHSSSDKGMNLQEQLGCACPASQEDFAAVPLDATASLPSLSPTISANPFKEYTALDAVSGGLSADSRYSQIEGETFKATTKSAQNPFFADDASEVAEQKSSEEVPPFTATEPFFLSQTKEPKGTKESFDIEKFSMYQQDSSPESPVELFAKRDKEVPLDGQHDIDDRVEKVSFRDDRFAKDEYVDFKPFEPPGAGDKSSSLKDVPRNDVDGKLESGIDKYDVEMSNPLPIEKNFEKESGSSNEDISFPSTPDAPEESSQAYVTCTKFESAVATEGSAAKMLPLVEEQPSENKTDEKKIAEMKAHLVSEPSSTHIELASGLGQKADSEKSEDLLKKLAAAAAAANMPEGLTPDLVQEVYESELHDAVSPKLAYETKMDLVQTSESSQEPLHATVQLCPSFEAESEAAPSPVLPDIVMEAPLNANTVGMGGPIIQLETSPLETFTAASDFENVKPKSEKPPSYQEAMNVPAAQTQETKAEAAEKEPDDKKDETPEDLETSYISIACDLVKETKVSNESALTGFVDYPKAERVSQAVPEPPEHLEKTLLPSGKSDSFSHQPEIELAQKKKDDVKEKPLETAINIVSKGAEEQKREEVPLSLGKPYLESFQPQVEPSKNVPPAWSLEAEAADLAKKEKTAQLHMEELNAYEDEFPVSEEPKDKIVLSAESSPEIDDFPTIPYQAAKLVAGATEKVELKENESKESCDMVKMEASQPPYQEVAQDLSLKNVHVKMEERELALEKPSEKLDREVPEAAKEPLPPADVTLLPAQKKVVSVDKEAERRAASVKEKEKTLHVFSSKLSKPSVVDLLYWRDIKKTGMVFGASLFLLLSLTVFSIVSVVAYIALFLLSVTISFRIYKGVIQAIQKSDEGHPFRDYLDKDVAVSEELVQKYSHVVLGHINSTVKELRRLFLVDDLVDSLKFAVLMWVFTYVGALFNGLTLLILALISLFSIPVIYEKHQAQIDHYVGLVNKNVKDAVAKVQAKIPGLKRKVE